MPTNNGFANYIGPRITIISGKTVFNVLITILLFRWFIDPIQGSLWTGTAGQEKGNNSLGLRRFPL